MSHRPQPPSVRPAAGPSVLSRTIRRTVVPRTLVLIAALLAAAPGRAAEEAQKAPKAQAPAAREAPAAQRPTVLVGVLTQQAQKQCKAGDHEAKWVNPWWEVGYTRVVPPDAVDVMALAGRPVVVEGQPAELPPPPPVESDGFCPVPQLRSDWEETPDGVRIRRGSGVALPGLRATAVRPFEGLSARLVGEGDPAAGGSALEIRLTNPFTVPITPTVTLHYEGCYGKPGTTSKQETLKELPPSGTVTVRFPVLDPEPKSHPGERVHRAASVQVTTPGSAVLFDLVVPLHRFPDVTLDCPRD